ncbi:hypothetical protein N7471_003797 [Penicillium samsonianum]|uniref:uncharacterized protein n=1 Tax=Penicillium samsonianum TaxID=1882272 RepID=UPI00254724BE|nr:uncharacterized protein N7471_003797 [Penicillium samsonianum]KAJ6137311.1 hypothetical protein N7471_003797 [Penicillium samsonianum]
MLIFSVYFHLTICPEGREDILKLGAELYRLLVWTGMWAVMYIHDFAGVSKLFGLCTADCLLVMRYLAWQLAGLISVPRTGNCSHNFMMLGLVIRDVTTCLLVVLSGGMPSIVFF